MSIRPSGLSGPTARLWRDGDGTGPATPEEPPVPGDLWVAAFDDGDFGRSDLALLLVHDVDEEAHLTRCSPVTPAEAPACEMTLWTTSSPLGVPLALWPGLETAVPFPALDRRIGPLLDAYRLQAVHRWAFPARYGLDGPRTAPLRQGPAPADAHADEAAEALIADLCRRMAVACYLDEPRQETA